MNGRLSAADVAAARTLCADGASGLMWSSYGGYYFSPRQALTLDLLLEALPSRAPARTVCHAALLMAASKCAAAPGHTAQPFAPSKTGLRFIHDLWRIDPLEAADADLRKLCARCAQVRGDARTGDAVTVAKNLRESDLVIIDPPYSAVQYSRFYHVLEALARRERFVPYGTGRYPPLKQRPQSDFSLVSAAPMALERLFANLAGTGCTALVTFPTAACSNGLSGDAVTALAREHFRVRTRRVLGRFSTMGGNNHHRPARHHSDELILTPRAHLAGGDTLRTAQRRPLGGS
jgi:adenine-specific DNA-methyltransferase